MLANIDNGAVAVIKVWNGPYGKTLRHLAFGIYLTHAMPSGPRPGSIRFVTASVLRSTTAM